MDRKKMNAVIIGSGNVATHLCKALNGFLNIIQIFSRDICHAKCLAEFVSDKCMYTDKATDLLNADIYIVSIKDDSIIDFLKNVPKHVRNAVWVHTSGSVPMCVFDDFNELHGVIYPLQTFSKNIDIDMRKVSFFIEGSSNNVSGILKELISNISDNIFFADSETRCRLHIAAVFSCNFVNYMYVIADDILKRNGIRFSVLTPLMEETLRKAESNSPYEVQTGPAVRGDRKIIEQHLSLLSDEEKKMYYSISESIIKRYMQE